jgi:AcrR family transcriptional regulator
MTPAGAASPAGTFVARDARERLCAAFAELADEHGVEAVEPGAVARLAGLAPDAFDHHFDDKSECLLAAFDAGAEQALRASSDAYVRTPGSWAEAVHTGLAGLLGSLSGSPAMTRLCMVDALAVKPVLDRRDRVLGRFADFLEPGFAQAPDPPPTVVSEAISGGIFELIRVHAVERRLESLPDSLPTVTLIALSPFVGNEHAERLATRPAGVRTGR